MILTTNAQRTFGVNEHTKIIIVFFFFFFRGKCHTKNRDCEHRKPRFVLVMNFIFLWHDFIYNIYYIRIKCNVLSLA